MGITTTSPYGRGQVAWPDFGHEGGTALHTKIVNSIAELSSNQDARWTGVVTLADTETETVDHNFDMPLSSLRVAIYESGVQIDGESQAKNYVIAQTNTNTITIQNVSGGSKTFFAYVWGFDFARLLGRYAARIETTDATPTTALDVPLKSDESAMLEFMVCCRKNGTTANSYHVTVQAENNAGTITVTELIRNEYEEVVAYDVVIAGSGNNVRVTVTGEAATTVEWYIKAETTYY